MSSTPTVKVPSIGTAGKTRTERARAASDNRGDNATLARPPTPAGGRALPCERRSHLAFG